MHILIRETVETRVRVALDATGAAVGRTTGGESIGDAAGDGSTDWTAVTKAAGAVAGTRDAAAEAAETKGGAAGPSRAGATEQAGPIRTGDAFLDHMLATLARYAGFALEVDASGDLRHHLIEDVAITIGLALQDEIPELCRRYGEATVPMDDALVHAALDVGGRFYYHGPLPSRLYDHFLRSLADNARITLHVRVLRGRDRHHIVEAAVKAVGLALRHALAPEWMGTPGHAGSAGAPRGSNSAAGRRSAPRRPAVFSTKGHVRVEREPAN